MKIRTATKPQYIEQYELLQQNTLYIPGQYVDWYLKILLRSIFSPDYCYFSATKNNPNQNKFSKYSSMNK